jgi:hypothetical protein
MARKTRTDDELRAVSEHLHYEAWMFLTLARAFATGVFGTGPINNAALEAFTIHARGLLDFLFAEDPREDDVVAGDFLTGQDWPTIRGEASPILDAVRKRVGKEVAHLTYARLVVKPEAKQWLFLDIAKAMEGLIGSFLAAVPKERLGPSWHPTEERE